MDAVTETQLPGIGVRFDFTSQDGDAVGVLCYNSGRREILVYGKNDPDRADSILQLSEADSLLLSDLLGAPQLHRSLGAVHQLVEGLEWVCVGDEAPMNGKSMGETHLRTRTGASVVAVIRGTKTEPAPQPEFVFRAGDVAVVVGPPDGIERIRAELRGHGGLEVPTGSPDRKRSSS